MFAVIHLPQFALQAALRPAPELWARPIALVDPALNTPRVCDLTKPALDQGVEPGQTPTQALARCRDVVIRHRSPGQESAATDSVLQCAYSFSPHIENSAPGVVTLDLQGLSELIGQDLAALERWAHRLRAALASLHLTARIGVGPTPNTARQAAFWSSAAAAEGSGDGSGIQIVTDSPAYIRALPVAALEPSSDVAEILRKWGVRTVGQLLALGQDAVMERLGLEALALFAAASTRTVRPLNLVRPAERYEEAFDFEQEVETIEPLLFILNRFVLQLSQRLELGLLAAEQLTLQLRLGSGELLEHVLRVPQPTRRSDVLLRMLQTHLDGIRTASPIAGVALRAVPARLAQKQFSLFEAALRDPHQFQETLARLSALVGPERVGSPVRGNSHRCDTFKLVPPDFENGPVVRSQRVPALLRPTPLRRLRPPLKAMVEEASTTADLARRPIPRRESRFPGNIVDLLGPLFSRQEPAVNRAVGPASPIPCGPANEMEPGSRLEPVAPVAPVPLSVRCQQVNGRLTIALGPWRSSGHWWEPGAWARDEWDAQTEAGQALRLVRSGDEWQLEAMLD